MFWVEGKQGRLRSGAEGMVINQTHITTSNICSKSPVSLSAFGSSTILLLICLLTLGAFLLFLTRLWCPIAAPLVTYKNIPDFSPSNWDIALLQDPYLTLPLRYSASALTLHSWDSEEDYFEQILINVWTGFDKCLYRFW